jgi:hypothetical protein
MAGKGECAPACQTVALLEPKSPLPRGDMI